MVNRVGSIVPPPRSPGSLQSGGRKVSTRPVVMVTPLIYSDSRCSVAGCGASRRRQPATWTDQLGALLEGLRDANRLRGHAGAQPVGQPVDLGTGLLGGGRQVGAELLGSHAVRRRVDRHDRRRRVQRRPRITASPTESASPPPTARTSMSRAIGRFHCSRFSWPVRRHAAQSESSFSPCWCRWVRIACATTAAGGPRRCRRVVKGPTRRDMALAGNCGSFPTRGGPARRSR